ncbi:hypothetical protein [Streptomyces sp. NPDC058374]|uniref:hypothetical protein n=1 Tax=unclassified Streptomyces TaxID=2593676 RepID=UPI003650D092
MKTRTALTRLAAATATTAALLLTGAATASAAAPDTPRPTANTSIRPTDSAPADRSPLTSLYRGVQGGNLCLLAHCTVGGDEGSAQVSNTQGANLCLLAVCSVRP